MNFLRNLIPTLLATQVKSLLDHYQFMIEDFYSNDDFFFKKLEANNSSSYHYYLFIRVENYLERFKIDKSNIPSPSKDSNKVIQLPTNFKTKVVLLETEKELEFFELRKNFSGDPNEFDCAQLTKKVSYKAFRESKDGEPVLEIPIIHEEGEDFQSTHFEFYNQIRVRPFKDNFVFESNHIKVDLSLSFVYLNEKVEEDSSYNYPIDMIPSLSLFSIDSNKIQDKTGSLKDFKVYGENLFSRLGWDWEERMGVWDVLEKHKKGHKSKVGLKILGLAVYFIFVIVLNYFAVKRYSEYRARRSRRSKLKDKKITGKKVRGTGN